VQFNYDGLKKAIAGAALQAGVNLPPVYALLDVSLLWTEEMIDLNRGACRGGYLIEHCNVLRWYGLRLNLELGRTLHWDSSIPCASWRAYLPLVVGGF